MSKKVVYRVEEMVSEILQSIACDSCGKTAEAEGGRVPGGFHTWELSGGYEDRFPADMEAREILVCDDCLEAWVKTFKNPDVQAADYYTPSTPCLHSETKEEMESDLGWLAPKGVEIDYEALQEFVSRPPASPHGVWRHFKGHSYLVLEVVQHVVSHEHYVVYRALYGESEAWARPLTEWWEAVKIDGDWTTRFAPHSQAEEL